jgi:predicted glutamine amidotransferase
MCELLGLAFNKPISPNLSFRGFRHRGERNPDGWGLATITPTEARITKETIRADQSDVSRALRDDPQLTAPIFIGHVRFASRGEVNLKNTHPFNRRINGSDFVFAHNGTLSMEQLNRRDTGNYSVERSTDSELAMCVLLSWMTRDKVDHHDYARIERFLKDLNATGKLNLLFSDGKRLYGYHDVSGYNGLCWTHRHAPFSQVSLRDEDWKADLGEEKAPDQKGFVIATRKLTDGEDWRNFRPGSLMVFERGDVVYGARR